MALSEGAAMLRIVGGIVVYGFAMFGLGVYLRRMHATRKKEAGC